MLKIFRSDTHNMRLTLVFVSCYLFFVRRTSHGADPACDVRWLTVPLAKNNGTEVLHVINDFPGSLSVYNDLPRGGVPTAVLEIRGDVVQSAHVHWREERTEAGTLQVRVYWSDSAGPTTNLTGEGAVVQPSSATNNNTIVVTVVILVAVFLLSSIFAFIYLQEKRRIWNKKRGDVGSSINKTVPYGTSSFSSFRDSYHRRRRLGRKSNLDNRTPVKQMENNGTDSETEYSPQESDTDDGNVQGDPVKTGHGIRVVFNSSSETLPPSILKKKTKDVCLPKGSAQGSGIGRPSITRSISGEAETPSNKDDVPDNAGYSMTVEADDLVDEQTDPGVVDVAVDVKPHDLILSSDSRNVNGSVTEDFEHITRNMKTQRVTFLTSTSLNNASCKKLMTVHVSEDTAENDRDHETRDKVVCTEGDHDSGTEADDEGKSRWNSQSKGRKGPPLGKKMLFIAVCVCVVVCMDTLSMVCPLTVSLKLHIPNNFLAPGSRFIIHSGSDVVYTPWLRRAPAQVYRYVNSSDDPELSRDFCAERVPSEMCEHTCAPDTGGCSCMDGYLANQQYPYLCLRNKWPEHHRLWPYDFIGRAYDMRTSQQSVNRVFRYTYGDTPHQVSRVVKPEQLDVHASNRCLPPAVDTADSVASVWKTRLDALSFTHEDDFVRSFGPVYAGDGGTENGVCKTGVIEGSSGCQCPPWLQLTGDGFGCYDHTREVDCSDGYDGGCDHTCARVNTSHNGNYTRVTMACSCREGYRLAADGRACLFSPVCSATVCGCNAANIPAGGRFNTTEEGHGTCVCNLACCRNLQVCKSEGDCELKQCVQKPKHGDSESTPADEHQTYPLGFRQMQYGYNGRTERITKAPIFQLTYSTNYSLSPLLVPDEVELTTAVRTDCQNYTGPVVPLRQQENTPNVRPGRPYIQTSSPEDIRQAGRMEDQGFRFSQEISVFGEDYRVYLRHTTLTADVKNTLGRLTAHRPRSDFIRVMEKFGTHYISQAVFGHREENVVYFQSLELANWIWATFTDSEGNQSFQAFVHSTLRAQEDTKPSESELHDGIQQVPDVETDSDRHSDRVQTVLRSWGRCAAEGCCTTAGTVMTEPALLYITAPTPLYELLRDKGTKEVFRRAFLSYLWCNGEGEVAGDTCRCDLHPSYPGHTLACAPPPKPSLYQPLADQPTDNILAVAWQHVGREIGVHVTDYQFVVREVRSVDIGLHGDDFANHPELTVSILDDVTYNRADSCYGRGLTHQGSVWTFSLLLMCLKPDTSYRISLRVLTRGGAVSPSDVLVLRTECQMPQLNHQPSGIPLGVADALYNLYAGYTSPLAQDMAFRILTSLNTIGLYDVAKTYEEKYDDFLLRTQEELGLTRTLLIRASLATLSRRCKTQTESGKIVRKVRRRYRCSFEGIDTRKGIREAILMEMGRYCVKYEEKYDSYDWKMSMYEE
ncbi:astrotactin-2-like isoform X2 [Branchiostoma lanceolatum]|uniref:astrotactin-2-like isoform X2 n=1 Tax=Branchiostoma lanceolatum TaxID=7740 RepID=UPI0034551208